MFRGVDEGLAIDDSLLGGGRGKGFPVALDLPIILSFSDRSSTPRTAAKGAVCDSTR